jgi:hypothetical protein
MTASRRENEGMQGVVIPLGQSICRFRLKLVITGRLQILHRTVRILSASNWCPDVAVVEREVTK